MGRTEEEREFRLWPRKPRLSRNERAGWSTGFKLLMHYARSTSKRGIPRPYAGKERTARPYHQRCAVRVTYVKNNTRGQWKAHGRYLAREIAHRSDGEGTGFSGDNERVDIVSKLEAWQKAGDQRLWKLIVSPEFGERVDLSRLTCDLMQHMAKDLGTDLEWVAVEHYNTEHPHIHIVISGLRHDGDPLRMGRQYVQQGIRSIAEDLCTRQLGYRTQLDAAEAERREISEKRFTLLDRRLMRDSAEISLTNGQQYFTVVRNPSQVAASETARLQAHHDDARLVVLQRMGLAESAGPNRWRVRRDFEQILRAMQQTTDRQRMLSAHGALISDERLSVEVLDLSIMTSVEGRVLVHGQDENSGRNYLMLEGTDAKVYFINYTPEIEKARSRGELRTNSFVRLRKLSSPRTLIDVNDLGNAERLLNNPRYLDDAARECLKRGIMPTEEGWGGWLGRYQATLSKTVRETVERKEREAIRERGREQSRGR
jgi:type IV secretory pathway VirD2 relaxase